jgi:hypothetical protein
MAATDSETRSLGPSLVYPEVKLILTAFSLGNGKVAITWLRV